MRLGRPACGDGGGAASDAQATHRIQHAGAVAPGPVTPAATVRLPAEELKAAIESSLIKSGLFQAAGPDGAPYRLDARVVDVSLPAFGASFTADVEIAWTFGRTSEPTTIVRRAIRTQHTVGAFEAFAGAARARMAVEGAVRRNIDEMLLLLAGQAH